MTDLLEYIGRGFMWMFVILLCATCVWLFFAAPVWAITQNTWTWMLLWCGIPILGGVIAWMLDALE